MALPGRPMLSSILVSISCCFHPEYPPPLPSVTDSRSPSVVATLTHLPCTLGQVLRPTHLCPLLAPLLLPLYSPTLHSPAPDHVLSVSPRHRAPPVLRPLSLGSPGTAT